MELVDLQAFLQYVGRLFSLAESAASNSLQRQSPGQLILVTDLAVNLMLSW